MEINNLEKFKNTMASGKTALGACITCYDPSVSELAADAGFDFIWIDMEHSPMTIVDAMHHVMAVRGTDCAPLVRAAWNEPWVLKPILDLAPAGIIIPMVNGLKSAEAAVKACRYPSQGGVRGCAMRRAAGYGKMPVDEYMEISKSDPMVIIQIEHIEAVRNIDEILKVPGIDSICIGPYDLSCSLGKPALFENCEVVGAIEKVCEKTLEAGLLLGAFGSPLSLWKKRGVNWTALTTDTGCLYAGFRNLIQSES